jgi:hypothetical protein
MPYRCDRALGTSDAQTHQQQQYEASCYGWHLLRLLSPQVLLCTVLRHGQLVVEVSDVLLVV